MKIQEILESHSLWLSGSSEGCRANLSRANLSRANLIWANLIWANLIWANLIWANLIWANLSRANLDGLDIPINPNLPKLVAQSALASDFSLEMGCWHTCDTTHCIAGWACVISGNKDKESELGTNAYAALLFARSGMSKIPNFFADNESAKEELQKWLQE